MGSGFKTFASAEVLTAANVNDYLMEQAVMTFATATARDAALVTAKVEGMVAYLEDTDRLTVYDGAEWTPPKNTAWGVDDTVTHDVGFQSLTNSSTVAVFPVTLRNDRQYQINASMSTLADDTTGTGGGTRFLMTATYDGTYANRVSYWQANADTVGSGSNVCVTFIVTGTGSSADLSFSIADQMGRAYDQTFRGYDAGDYCTLVITDIGPA
jgi:hypothetical protein